MSRFIFALSILFASCAHAPKETPVTPSPFVEEAEKLTVLPPYTGTSAGQAVSIEEGDKAPFSGVLLSEEKAAGAAELRISYDQVYQLAGSDRKYLLAVVRVQDRELILADRRIDDLNGQLKELRDSWWERHKLDVGIGIGIVVGVGLSIATGYVWAEVDSAE